MLSDAMRFSLKRRITRVSEYPLFRSGLTESCLRSVAYYSFLLTERQPGDLTEGKTIPPCLDLGIIYIDFYFALLEDVTNAIDVDEN